MSVPAPLLSYPITICGLAELAGHAETPFSHVVSILDPAWPEPKDFVSYIPHQRVVWRFDDVLTQRPGVIPPNRGDIQAILNLGEVLVAEPAEHLLIHCHAGVSRSTAAAIILLAQHNPSREREAFVEVARVRPRSWPNALMLAIADDLLGRDGALTAALRSHQRQVVRNYPDLAEMLLRGDRAHEVFALEEDEARAVVGG